MPEPIYQPLYWRERLCRAIDREQVHHAIYECSREVWDRIARRHREILATYIGPTPECSILDAGCGWGRLLSLLPHSWKGVYAGVDLSSDFVQIARAVRPDRAASFYVGDLRNLSYEGITRLPTEGTPLAFPWCDRYDWCICISLRPMVVQNAGTSDWLKIHSNLCAISKCILYLEYDPKDDGEVYTCPRD